MPVASRPRGRLYVPGPEESRQQRPALLIYSGRLDGRSPPAWIVTRGVPTVTAFVTQKGDERSWIPTHLQGRPLR